MNKAIWTAEVACGRAGCPWTVKVEAADTREGQYRLELGLCAHGKEHGDA